MVGTTLLLSIWESTICVGHALMYEIKSPSQEISKTKCKAHVD